MPGLLGASGADVDMGGRSLWLTNRSDVPQGARQGQTYPVVVHERVIEYIDERDPGQEKIRSGPTGTAFPNFPPYLEDQTGQTEEMVRAYRRMLSDPDVSAALLCKVLAVAVEDVQFQPPVGLEKDKRTSRIGDFLTYNFCEAVEGGMPGIVWSVLGHGCIDGHSICEKVRAIEHRGQWAGKQILDELKPKMPGDVAIQDTDEYLN